MTFSKEPTIWLGVIRAGLYLAAHFGLTLSAEQTAAIILFCEAVTVLINRQVVTPTTKPKDPPQSPPSDKTPPTGTLRTLSLVSVLAFSCAGIPTEHPPCDQATLAGIIAECSLRVETECAANGVPESDCQALKDCDARLEKRTADCR